MLQIATIIAGFYFGGPALGILLCIFWAIAWLTEPTEPR